MAFDYSPGGVVSRTYRFDLLSYFMDIGYVVIYKRGSNEYVLPLMPWREGDWKYILVFTRCYAISDSPFISDCGELRADTDRCAAEALKIPVDKADEIYAELSVEKVAHLPFGSEMDDIKEYVEHVNGELARLLREFITTIDDSVGNDEVEEVVKYYLERKTTGWIPLRGVWFRFRNGYLEVVDEGEWPLDCYKRELMRRLSEEFGEEVAEKMVEKEPGIYVKYASFKVHPMIIEARVPMNIPSIEMAREVRKTMTSLTKLINKYGKYISEGGGGG